MEKPDDTVSQETLQFIQELADNSCELDNSVNQVNSILANYLSLPIDDLQFSSLDSKFTDIMSQIDHEIHKTEQAISMIKHQGDIPSIETSATSMLSSKHRKMFDFLLTKELEIVSMPYPPLCGAIPQNEDELLPIGSFVAAKVENDFIVCYVQGIQDTKYIIADATLDQAVGFPVEQNEVIPMPTTLPDRKTKITEYPPGTKVLSLWPVESTWTSVFYVASVIKGPSETGRCYRLKFYEAEDKSTFVPEKYVIPHP
ncbi:hypothetical protein TRFO_36719 [Tritrichomonas foetus]|uniref:SGF29 C-terminal domain-containing protein n=1 Tax=Tritrichomonas foetus TaxID=1144522 RepID=A0A1J4JDG1_9EUKA|nr:hypothetical protein TRFO_36719 [Tritrichomonas foetus]|eukprot:OHS97136.1 hypothetical protein TRFO_36719 [Tritrichomonas foetus]